MNTALVRMLIALVACCALARGGLAGFESAQKNETEARAPSNDAPPLKVFQHVSKNGLRYTWAVPKGYTGKTPRNLTVICHGTGLDYRWGHWNCPVGVFRPDDIVVSVDGPTTANDGTRLFMGEKKDVDAIAAFLKEMRECFAVDRIFLYGHSQGGFFVVYFAGEHPELVAGVVAHASGSWNGSKMMAPVKKVAIAFMHGTQDPVVPYGQSPGARDAYAKEGFDLLYLRRIEGYNHWPNELRATECLDWCEGITTSDPATALACAKRMLTVKKTDQYGMDLPVAFSGARAVLRRFEPKSPNAIANAPADIVAEAAKLSKAIEDEGAKHVAALAKKIAKRADLKLGAEPWLGHLLPLREDFRGVDSVESYLKTLDFDKAREAQAKNAGEIFSAWYDGKDPKKQFVTIQGKIGEAFLVEGYPPELGERMAQWKKDAAKLGLKDKDLKPYADFEAWRDGWTKGLEKYRAIWKDWKGP
jgi:predicted esterase